MPNIITYDMLVKLDACEPQKLKFRQLFPNGAELTTENVVTALNAGLDVDWFTRKAFTLEHLHEYRVNTMDPALRMFANQGNRKHHAEAIANAFIAGYIASNVTRRLRFMLRPKERIFVAVVSMVLGTWLSVTASKAIVDAAVSGAINMWVASALIVAAFSLIFALMWWISLIVTKP